MWIRNATKCVGWLEDNEALRCTSWTKMWCSMKCKWVPHKPFNQIQTPGWEGDWTISRAQGALNRLEIESHKIEKATWNLQNTPSQHHVTQGMGMRILQALTPRGFSLDMRIPEKRDLRWSHPLSLDLSFPARPALPRAIIGTPPSPAPTAVPGGKSYVNGS